MLCRSFENLCLAHKYRHFVNKTKFLLFYLTYSNNVSIEDNVCDLQHQFKSKDEGLVNVYKHHRQSFENNFHALIKETFFINSADIYGGLKGVYDYGPSGCNLKNDIIHMWRDSFVSNENILEIDSSILTSKQILQASGHLRYFKDMYVQDQKSGNLYRCDHLISKWLSQLKLKTTLSEKEKKKIDDTINKLNTMNQKELQNIIDEYKIIGPDNGTLTETGQFNLLFSVMNSSENNDPIYLRPETAQGIFTNFPSLLKFNHNKLPFGVAQVGTSFRNEISPEHKLIRAREFQMAEIEYFFNPDFTDHNRFHEVADLEMNIWLESDQEQSLQSKKVSLKSIVDEKHITENHAYFLGRIYQFLIKVGIDPEKLRFRQHLVNERAHYSNSCWDAECHTSLGWIECVGCSNRGSYDLVKHTGQSGISLHVAQSLNVPDHEIQLICNPNLGEISKVYKVQKKLILNYLKKLSQPELVYIKSQITSDGQIDISIDNENYIITKEMISFEMCEIDVKVKKVFPHVIEPSFGIGRILHCVLEHNFCCRKDNLQRIVLTLPNSVAPFKVSVLPLMSTAIFEPVVKKISALFNQIKVRYLVDYSKESIGRRYSRLDAIGTPFIVTVDYNSINPNLNLVTIRERNSMEQIQVQISDLQNVIGQLLSNELSWKNAVNLYSYKVKCTQ